MVNVKNIKIGGQVYPIEDTEARTQAAQKLSDFKINGTSVVTDTVANLTIESVLTSTSETAALSAAAGKALNDRIDNVSGRGRFLSLWDATTGKPTTEPTSTLPYIYKTGDYFIVTKVGETNYIPTGTQYTGAASTVTTTEKLAVGDQFLFDADKWIRFANFNPDAVLDVTVDGTSVVSGNTAVIVKATSTETGVLSSADWQTFNGKQDKLTFDSTPIEDSTNPVTSGGVYEELALKQSKIPAGTAGNVLTYSGTAGSVGSKAIDTAAVLNSDNLITSGGVAAGLATKQDKALVTTWQSTVDDTHYPSEKLVKEALDTKQAEIPAGTLGEVVGYSGVKGSFASIGVDAVPTEDSDNLVKSSGVFDELATKQHVIDATHTVSAEFITETESKKFNVQANWNSTSGLSAILNKPSAFTPEAHAATHAKGGSDELTLAQSQITNLESDLAAKQEKIPAKVSAGAAVVAMTGVAGTVSELAIDTAATASSSNLITSGAVKAAIDAFEPTIDASGNLIFGPAE